jgi:hypothetical protein
VSQVFARRPDRSDRPWFASLAAAALAFALAPAVRGQVADPGFASSSFSIAPPGAFVGGLEVLPNGDLLVFDGTSVVELAPSDGSLVRTVWSPGTSLFAAFLRLSPDALDVYFGESSSGHIWEIELSSGLGQIVAQAYLPYDFAFDPKGRAFVSYATALFSGSHVALVDLTTGALDDVFDSPDPSGPIAFDAAGDLFTATTDVSTWPPPPGAATVYRLAAADVEGAIGPGVLTPADGANLGSLDGASFMVLDEAEDLIITDPNGGRVVQLTPSDGRQQEIAVADPGGFLTYASFVRGTRGAYEPWQPAEAGALLVTETDFFSTNLLARLTPGRATLSTTPASPVPVGPFTFDVGGAAPNGFGFLLVAPAGVASQEQPLHNRSWPAPLWFGLDLGAGLSIFPIVFDGAGGFTASASNPGLGDVTIGLQLVVGATASGPWYGTSAPLALELD